MSQKANELLEQWLSETERMDYNTAVQRLTEELGIQKNSAQNYIARSAVASKEETMDGEKYITHPANTGETVLAEEEESELLGVEVGDTTGDRFGELAVLEDKGFLLDAEGHADGYFRRKMSDDPNSDLSHKTDVQVVTSVMDVDDASTMLIGRHGVGKDKLVLHICAKTNRPAIRLVGNDDPDFVDLLIGTFRPNESGDFEFAKGLLTVAIENGYTFILDEFNALSGKVQTMLNKILEGTDSNELAIPETNEIISPHPEFNFVATMNPNEIGYGGREDVDQATGSRFIPVNLPPLDEETEKMVVAQETEWDKDSEELDLLLRPDGGVVSGIRGLHEMGKISMWVSTRDVLQIGWMTERIGSAQAAAELVLTGRADRDDKEPIRNAINDHNWP